MLSLYFKKPQTPALKKIKLLTTTNNSLNSPLTCKGLVLVSSQREKLFRRGDKSPTQSSYSNYQGPSERCDLGSFAKPDARLDNPNLPHVGRRLVVTAEHNSSTLQTSPLLPWPAIFYGQHFPSHFGTSRSSWKLGEKNPLLTSQEVERWDGPEGTGSCLLQPWPLSLHHRPDRAPSLQQHHTVHLLHCFVPLRSPPPKIPLTKTRYLAIEI